MSQETKVLSVLFSPPKEEVANAFVRLNGDKIRLCPGFCLPIVPNRSPRPIRREKRSSPGLLENLKRWSLRMFPKYYKVHYAQKK
jgi:hypothetical protein